jgi:glycosyltransferase involved in cell wall biosynthesis
MEIHQVVATARPGDAVTNLALEYRELLRRIGPSEIVAEYRDPAIEHEVRDLDWYRRRPSSPSDLVLYHASIGAAALVDLLLARRERIGVVYHNVTPAEWFKNWSPVLERLCREGREELALLLRRAVLAVAVSEFNAAELAGLGGPPPRVVPPVLDPARLARVEPDPAVAAALAARPGPHFVHVAQVLPHKRPEQLVQAFHLLVTHLHPTATLAIVGSTHLAPFVAAVERQVAELGLDGCALLGTVDDPTLAAHLRRADAFVTASEHEGFCVPLLEAMALDTPAVAKAVAAVPETAGGAALLLPPDAGPALLAEAMAMMAERPEVSAAFVRAGRERLAEVAAADPRAALLEALAEVV